MRRRIRSDTEVKEKKLNQPKLLSQSHSLKFSDRPKTFDMHFFLKENCAVDHHGSEKGVPCNFSSFQPSGEVLASLESTSPVILPDANLSSPTKENVPLCPNNKDPAVSPAHCHGRPTSLSSVTSSRTSRGSDYFSSSSSTETHHQLTSHNSGTQFDLTSSDVTGMEAAGGVNRSVLNKVVETVREEEEEAEEGFVDDEPLAPAHEKHFNNSSNNGEETRVHETQLPQNAASVKQRGNVSAKDINKRISEVDHLSPVATMAMVANPQLTYVDRIILELLETERMYVRALEDILAGYILAIKNTTLPISSTDAKKLFGNIKDIYAFNRKFLCSLENCEFDPVKIAKYFVTQDVSFSVYTEYCTNYPISVAVLTKCMKNPILAEFFKIQQASLRHNLPLGSYLLKPVQRILKYHLILQEMVKNCDEDLENYSVIEKALSTMTYIARHINDMKRKHEDAVHIQEIQSLLANWQGDDLTTYGEIAMEGELRLQGAKNERMVFLFDKMILITKRREDGFQVKTHIMCSDMILLDSIKENPLSFLISPFDSPSFHTNNHNSRAGKQYVLTAKYLDEKKLWTQNIKRLIIKNHHVVIPLQAQQSIMNMDTIGLDDGNDPNQRKTFHTSIGEKRMPSLKKTSSTLSMNARPRHRSNSMTKKGLPLKGIRRKHDSEIGEDFQTESVPTTPNIIPGRGRFSFPRIGRSTSPKSEALNDVAPPVAEKEDVVPEIEREEKCSCEGDAEEEKADEEMEVEENSKEDKTTAAKKNEKYKDSVIYRRHKRRKNQPSAKPELKLNIPIANEEGSSKNANQQDISLDDFETAEDFLSSNVENNRESVSWDIQIVEAVFERFKKEKEAQKAKEEKQQEKEQEENPLLIPMPHRQQSTDASSNMLPSDEIPPPPLNDVEKSIIVNAPHPRRRMSSEMLERNFKSQAAIKEPTKHVTEDTTDATIAHDNLHLSVFDESEKESSGSSDDEADTKENAREATSDDSSQKKTMQESGNKVKRSLSGQSSYAERRKYFERLKEIRDRRHHQFSPGADAVNIQTGHVREMIQHHRENVAHQSQQLRGGLPPPARKSNPVERRKSEPRRRGWRSDGKILASPTTANGSPVKTVPPVVLRKPTRRRNSLMKLPDSSKVDIEETFLNHPVLRKLNLHRLELEDNDVRSSYTTESLALSFTSSSSSNDNDDAIDPPSPYIPKYKKLLQPQLLLWRTFAPDSGSVTRKSKNLVIESSPASVDQSTKVGSAKSESSMKLPNENRFSFKELGKIETNDAATTDELSQQVDSVWNDLEVFRGKNPVTASDVRMREKSLVDDDNAERRQRRDRPMTFPSNNIITTKAISSWEKAREKPNHFAKTHHPVEFAKPEEGEVSKTFEAKPTSNPTSTTIVSRTRNSGNNLTQPKPTRSAGALKDIKQEKHPKEKEEKKSPERCKHAEEHTTSNNTMVTERGETRFRRSRTREQIDCAGCSVMKLAQQFDSITVSPTSPTRTLRRSHSACPRRHLSDLRLSSSSISGETTKSAGKINYDQIRKETKKSLQRQKSSVTQRKIERNFSPPKRMSSTSQLPLNESSYLDRQTREKSLVSNSQAASSRPAALETTKYVRRRATNLVDTFRVGRRTADSRRSTPVTSAMHPNDTSPSAVNRNVTDEPDPPKTNKNTSPSDFVAMFCKV